MKSTQLAYDKLANVTVSTVRIDHDAFTTYETGVRDTASGWSVADTYATEHRAIAGHIATVARYNREEISK